MYRQIGQRLREEATKRPELANTIELYCALLEAQARARIEPGAAPDPGEASARLEQGLPILSPETVKVDGQALAELCDEIVDILGERQPEQAASLAAARVWLDRERGRLGAVAVEYLREGRIGEGEEADLLAFILDTALQPFLRALAQTLVPLVEDGAWQRGMCPVCGGEPDFAVLDRKSARRRLLCSRCDTEWTFRRVGCPFCGNDDARLLGYYPSDDGAYRLTVCEVCRRYVKTIDLRQAAGERLSVAERVLTVGMDLAAQEAGYGSG